MVPEKNCAQWTVHNYDPLLCWYFSVKLDFSHSNSLTNISPVLHIDILFLGGSIRDHFPPMNAVWTHMAHPLNKYLWGFLCIVNFPWHSLWEQAGDRSNWRNSQELTLSFPNHYSFFCISYMANLFSLTRGLQALVLPWRWSRACEGDQVANRLLKWDEAVICASDIALLSIPSAMLQPRRNERRM